MSGGDKGPLQQGPGHCPFPPQLLLHLHSCSPWDLNATLRSTTPSLALGANTGVSSKAFSWHGQQSCPHPKSQPCSPEQLSLCRCGHAILLFSWPRTFQPFLPQSGTGVPSPSIPSSWTPADASVCSYPAHEIEDRKLFRFRAWLHHSLALEPLDSRPQFTYLKEKWR